MPVRSLHFLLIRLDLLVLTSLKTALIQLQTRGDNTLANLLLPLLQAMSLPPGYSISPAAMGIDYQELANLALQYSQWLGVDLCFQVGGVCAVT